MTQDSIDEKDREQQKTRWLRGLFMLLFLIVYEIAQLLLVATAVVQFLFSVITGKSNYNLRNFGSSLGQYARQIIDYVTYNSAVRPFPFTEWPVPEAADEVIESPPPNDSSS